MDEQENRPGSHPDESWNWYRALNVKALSPEGDSCVPDFAILRSVRPLIAVEVAFSQTLPKVRAKLRDYYRPMPSLCAVIVVNIAETPRYSSPALKTGVSKDLEFWNTSPQLLELGKRIKVQGHTWLGDTVCSIIVWVPQRDEEDGREIFAAVSSLF